MAEILSIKAEGEDSPERMVKQLRYLMEKTRIFDIYKESLEYHTRAEKKRKTYLKAVYTNQKRLEMQRKKRGK